MKRSLGHQLAAMLSRMTPKERGELLFSPARRERPPVSETGSAAIALPAETLDAPATVCEDE
jgi:hypothetical protein